MVDNVHDKITRFCLAERECIFHVTRVEITNIMFKADT